MHDDSDEGISFDVDVDDGESIVRVVGTRDAAVVVTDPDGESIYLPPENFAGDLEADERMQSSYGDAVGDSPYDGVAPTRSPYEGMDDRNTSTVGDAEGSRSTERPIGVTPTPEGFRIRHPAPIHDVRLLR